MMPHFLTDLLKKKSPEMKPKGFQLDSISEVTLIEKPKLNSYASQKNNSRQINEHFNPADLCFGSCCRN
ncbi:hypothetical protein BDV29DRAFT_13984 [Aspergillus leporis]|uniref:Uncharacterized protein n=1 Tax=Aspergillus leporis TaxID=41062 RepID=A0A5N5WTK4_9EURO|nr:hypothetical protein BDV29DRAFT_13984 [Aspergillus leporis]